MSTLDPENQDVRTLAQIGPFEQFFKEHYAFICQTVFRYVNDKTKTEDIVQEIFAELWVKRETIQIHTSVHAYLRRMALTRALNYIRNTKKYNWDELDTASEEIKSSAYQEASVVLQMEESELKEKIERAINQLPGKCKVIFLLSRNEEMSYVEISRQLDISVKTVENQIGKALKLLRKALAGHRG